MTTVAIMQPTYLPWSGYFGLIESVDIFVILDTVQFAKRSWQQRNSIKTPNGNIFLTVPDIFILCFSIPDCLKKTTNFLSKELVLLSTKTRSLSTKNSPKKS